MPRSHNSCHDSLSLNSIGIILFLRFGFLLGQAGLLGTLGLLAAAYAIDFLTATSVSAIATNGHVRGRCSSRLA